MNTLNAKLILVFVPFFISTQCVKDEGNKTISLVLTGNHQVVELNKLNSLISGLITSYLFEKNLILSLFSSALI